MFAVFPVLMLLVLQGELLYTTRRFWGTAAWEPTIFLVPFIAPVAASGFFTAARCARTSLRGALAVGMSLGCLWTVILWIIGYIVVLLSGGRGLLWYRVAPLTIFFACGLCVWSRYYGRARSAV
jgi:hypothetical protein